MQHGFMATGLCGALTVVAATQALAAESWSETTIKPIAATSLDVSGVHVVSYFEPIAGSCQLTMMIGAQDVDQPRGTPTRLRLTIEPGRAAFIENADGGSSRFTCLYAAQAMNVFRTDRLSHGPTQ